MATAGILNGTSLLLYVDVSGTPTPIAYATSGSLSINMDTRETTNKEKRKIKTEKASLQNPKIES